MVDQHAEKKLTEEIQGPNLPGAVPIDKQRGPGQQPSQTHRQPRQTEAVPSWAFMAKGIAHKKSHHVNQRELKVDAHKPQPGRQRFIAQHILHEYEVSQ